MYVSSTYALALPQIMHYSTTLVSSGFPASVDIMQQPHDRQHLSTPHTSHKHAPLSLSPLPIPSIPREQRQDSLRKDALLRARGVVLVALPILVSASGIARRAPVACVTPAPGRFPGRCEALLSETRGRQRRGGRRPLAGNPAALHERPAGWPTARFRFAAQAAGFSEVVAEHRVPLVQELESRDLGFHPARVDLFGHAADGVMVMMVAPEETASRWGRNLLGHFSCRLLDAMQRYTVHAA